MDREMRIWAGAALAMLTLLGALVAAPQIDTRSGMERAQDQLRESIRELERLN